jgi:heterodisulfide reductase subunit A
MTTALSIARQGFRAYLVERERALGGNMRHLQTVLEGGDPQERLDQLVREVNEHPMVEVMTGTEVESISGFVGNFETVLSGREGTIEHGVVVLATGGSELKPQGHYLYGEEDGVLTQQELEDELSRTELPPGPVVMIQCVGSRNEERPYCSRVCCTTAIKNAIRIREVDPEQPVYILYRDIRTYGFREMHYRRAAELGVIFVRFRDERPPEVTATGDGLRVRVEDMTTGGMLEIPANRLVLSSATLPRPDNEVLAKMLKVPLSKDGFFLEAHMKLRPLDFATDGVFLCGMAHWPKFVDETIAQALGAAARAVTVLSLPHIEAEGVVASVDQELCRGCGRCTEVCEYGAVALEEVGDGVYASRVNEVLCKGCGACAVRCPTKAISVRHFTDDQIMAMVETMLREVG